MEKKYISEKFKHILHGGDYNPDQWTEHPDVLDEDMRLMKLANCNSMTVGIFAWAKLEPADGVYDFSFLDKTIDDVYANGGRIVLATPSGARPAWLAQKYPEVLRVNADRTKNIYGARHNHCYSSPVYRRKVTEINRRLAERYKDHPALIMWHLSNEYGGECHCELCRENFRTWLKNKYGTLDKLNYQWWNGFWAHTYTDWSQIEPPSPIGEKTEPQYLDWMRFVTYQTTDFMKCEIAAIRDITPDVPITTNLMGFYPGLDYRVMSKELDVISWDNYPYWRGSDAYDIATASDIALTLDLNRGFKHRPFMLMESTPSSADWHEYSKLKRPGQHTLASLQAVAHGSDTVQYFQWRKSRGNNEKFHGAVVDHVGHENTRVFREVSALGARLKKLDCIVGTGTVSRVAMLYDWSNQWAFDDTKGFHKSDKKFMQTVQKHYRSLWQRGINVDVIGYEDDLTKYDLVIAPLLYSVTDALIDKLENYVRNGGTLLSTYASGYVNENDLCYLGGFPAGKLKDVFGIWNEEIDTLYPDEYNTVKADSKEYKAVDYCEIIHQQGAKAIATYESDFYKGGAAATVNAYGKGEAYYVAFRDEGDYTDMLTEEIISKLGITSDFDGVLPYGVSAHSRTDGENVFVFIENYSVNEAKLTTVQSWTDVETECSVTGEIVLAPYQTLILSKKL